MLLYVVYDICGLYKYGLPWKRLCLILIRSVVGKDYTDLVDYDVRETITVVLI